MGGRRRKTALWILSIVRPVHSIGRFARRSTAPPPTSRTKAPTPSHAALAKPRSTATPPKIAGRDSTGRANSVAGLIRDAAARPAAILSDSIPPPTSRRYWGAAPTAAPPGTVLVIALPASCDVPIRK